MYIKSIYNIMNILVDGEMDMNYKLYDFPTEADGVNSVEQKLCELMVKYRNDQDSLDPIEVDYMDWANSVIMTSDAR